MTNKYFKSILTVFLRICNDQVEGNFSIILTLRIFDVKFLFNVSRDACKPKKCVWSTQISPKCSKRIANDRNGQKGPYKCWLPKITSADWTDWEKWREISEEKFSEWNSINHADQSIDETVESFMELFHESMEEAVPKVTVKEGSRRKMCLEHFYPLSPFYRFIRVRR